MLTIQRPRAARIQAGLRPYPRWEASATPKTIVRTAPATTITTPAWVRRSRVRISLGRSRLIAPICSVPATAAPAKKQNAPSRWKNRSQWYAVTAVRYFRGCERAAPPTADRDDLGRQLDARPRGGAPPRRGEGGGRARGRRLLRVPLRGALHRARVARDARHERRGDDAPAAHASRRGNHGHGGRGADTGDDPVGRASRSALQAVP